ncbi:MAG: hypothetical protein KAR42_05905 [candidate division Zixibacteria bacterium]|nr:hypothetical protein [candidate division Zixibacteria bacterium]
MIFGIRKKYWWYLACTGLLLGFVAFAHISPVFALKEYNVIGPLAETVRKQCNDSLQIGANLFRLDSDMYIDELMTSETIENVTLHLSLPSGIRAEVNRFEPIVLVLADKLYGLDKYSRLVPFDIEWETKNLPVYTGLKIRKLFEIPEDYRVSEVTTGLRQIIGELPDLFQQIAEIDFSDKTYIKVFLTTSTDTYLAQSRNFYKQLYKLHAIREMAISSDNGCYNLQFDNIVIKH